MVSRCFTLVMMTLAVWADQAAGDVDYPPPTPAPVDHIWAGDLDPDITFKDDYAATVEHNRQRWREAIWQDTGNEIERQRRLNLRLAILHERCGQRFAEAAANDPDYHRRIVEHYREAGQQERAFGYLVERIEQRPGDAASAVEALSLIQRHAGWRDDGASGDNGRAWAAYAARRLVAMAEADLLDPSTETAVNAMRILAQVKLDEGAYHEAAALLDRAETAGWQVDQTRLIRVDLDLAVGRMADAEALLAALDDLGREAETRRARLQPDGGDAGLRDLPIDRSAELRWKTLRRTDPAERTDRALDAVAALADPGGLVPTGGRTYTSAWTAMDRLLLADPQAAAAAAARSDDARAVTALSSARRDGDAQAMLDVFRRWPWAPAGLDAALAYGSEQLRRGAAAEAERAFTDVLQRTSDRQRVARATVGRWLAMAQQPDRHAALVEALREIDNDATWPWFGHELTGRAVRQRLLDAVSAFATDDRAAAAWSGEAMTVAAPAAVAAGHRVPPAALGQHMTGAAVAAATDGEAVFVAGPDALRAIDPATGRTIWQRARPPLAIGGEAFGQSIVRPRWTPSPVMAGRTIVTCWARTADGVPAMIAALDATTGRTRWTSAASPGTMGLRPIGDPAVAGSRVYALMRGPIAPEGPGAAALVLVSFDQATGEPIWTRDLGMVGLTLPYHDDAADDGANVPVDMLHGSAAITASGGMLYISAPGMTLAADARDGLVHWLVTHDRAPLGTTAAAVMPRRATAPLVTDALVIVAPRDWHGVRAIRRDTGEPAWADRHLPADRLLGVAGRTVYAASDRAVFAIDPTDGRVRWRQAAVGPIQQATLLDGRTIVTAGDRGVHQLDLDGGIRSRVATSSAAAAVTAGDRLVMVDRTPGEPTVADPPPGLDVLLDQAYPHGEPIATLPTGGNRLATIAPGMGPAHRALAFGDGAATLIDAGDKPRVVWRQTVPPGAASVHWSRFAVTLVYHRRAIGLALEDGRVIFDHRADFPIDLAAAEQRYLILGQAAANRAAGWAALTVIDTETGRPLWHRTLADLGKDRRYVGVARAAWHDRKLLALAGVQMPANRFAQITIDPATGRIESIQPIMENKGRWPEGTTVGPGRWWLITDGRDLYEVPFDQPGQPIQHRGRFDDFHPHRDRRFDAVGDHLLFDRPDDRKHWIATAGEPGSVREYKRAGYLRDGLRHHFDGQTLHVFDETAGEQITQSYPISSEGHDLADITLIDFWYADDRLHAVTAHRPADSDRLRLRLDRFYRDGSFIGAEAVGTLPAGAGEHLGPLPTERDRPTPVRRIGRNLVVLSEGRTSIHPPNPTSATMRRRPVAVAFAADPSFRIDGSIGEWRDSPSRPVNSRDERAVDLRFAWRDHTLLISSAVDDPRLDPTTGDPADGDRLVAIVQADGKTTQHVLGLGRRGSMLTTTAPDRTVGAAGIDARSLRRTYELAIDLGPAPFDQVKDLAVRLAWYDGSHGDQPIATWPAPGSYGASRAAIRPRQIEGRTLDATVKIAGQLTMLPETRRIVVATMNDLAGDPATSLEFANRLLRAAPDGPFVYQVLCLLDQSLRRRPDDPRVVQVVNRLGESAGVPTTVMQKYRAIAGAAFSQWYFVPVGEVPTRTRLMLHDGRGWAARLYFGNPDRETFGPDGSGVAWHLGPMRAGQWTEVRLPMLALAMADQPIHGVHFQQTDDGTVYWDDTAVIANGQAQVFIGDDTPQGRRQGNWNWTDKVRRSGRRSHASGDRRGSVDVHAVTNLKSPVAFHVQPRQPDGDPGDPATIRAVLERQLPRLGATAQAREMLGPLRRAQGDDQSLIDWHFWFVTRIPHHPQRLDIADRIVVLAKATGTDATREVIAEHLADRRVPDDVAYRIRRDYLEPHRRFVREWLIHGPLTDPRGPDNIHAEDRIDPATPLRSVKRDDWQAYRGQENRIDLGRQFKNADRAGALALCWIRSDRQRDLKLSLGVDDVAKLWVNGTLVHRNNEYPGDGPGQLSADIALRPGWNTAVMKVTNTGGGPWYFYFELVDPAPNASLEGVTTSIEPPTD